MDLVVANAFSNNVAVLLGNGSGEFPTAVTYGSGGNRPCAIAVGDFNRDGKLDLAVANSSSNNIGILFGSGNGKFTKALTYASGGTSPSSLAAGYFNGDEYQDLAVANRGELQNVAVLLGTAAGGFEPAVAYAAHGSSTGSVTVGDFNHDLKDDIAFLSGYTIRLLLQNEAGGLDATVDRDAVRELVSVNGVTFGVQATGPGAGQLVAGAGGAFDGLNRLRVGVADYSAGAQGSYLTNGDRTLVTPTVTLAGLNVHREITVPDSGSYDYAKTVDVFQNITDSPITTTVRMIGNLGSNQNTEVWQTTDQWIGTDDKVPDGGMPAIVHAFDGTAMLATSPRLLGDQGDNLEWTYEITVPARSSVELTHLTIVAATRAAAEAAVAILLTPNQPPVAMNDGVTTAEDTPVTIDVLANDVDPDGDALQVVSVSQGNHGAVVNNGNGMLTYTPNLNFHGSDSFTYMISDGRGGFDTATVEITVTPVNDAPVAQDDAHEVAPDGVLTVDVAHGMLANDSDVDGDPLTAVWVSGPSSGALDFNADGSFTFTPAVGFRGDVTFTYRAKDSGDLESNVATVTITVQSEVSETLTFSSTDVPKSIADALPGNRARDTVSQLVVSGTGVSIATFQLDLAISHGRPSDLSAVLRSPGNVEVQVFPQGTTSLPTQWTTDAFGGQPLDGTWRLILRDHVRGTTGTLTAWSITVTAASGASGQGSASGVSGLIGWFSQDDEVDALAIHQDTRVVRVIESALAPVPLVALEGPALRQRPAALTVRDVDESFDRGPGLLDDDLVELIAADRK